MLLMFSDLDLNCSVIDFPQKIMDFMLRNEPHTEKVVNRLLLNHTTNIVKNIHFIKPHTNLTYMKTAFFNKKN